MYALLKRQVDVELFEGVGGGSSEVSIIVALEQT